MGVPKFYRWISERYPKIIQRHGCIPTDETLKEHFPDEYERKKAVLGNLPQPDLLAQCYLAPEIDRLYIDMNGIVHGCSHNNGTVGPSGASPNEEQIFRNICYYLDRIVKDIIKPTELVYLAVDGVAPRAKLNQQRARRFRSSKEGEIAQTIHEAHMQAVLEQENLLLVENPMDDNQDGSIQVTGPDATSQPHDALNGTNLKSVGDGRYIGKFETSSTHTSPPSTDQSIEATKALDTISSADSYDISFDKENDEDEEYSSTHITPGTLFFKRFFNHMETFIKKKVSTDPVWKNLKIVLSGPNVPGEGEHKIVGFIRDQRIHNDNYDPNTRHCIVGQDGDLVMLGLATHEPNLVLLRETVHFRKQAVEVNYQLYGLDVYTQRSTFELLHMNILRDYIAYEFLASNVVKDSPYDLERCVDDFVFLTFLVGNDFLPPMPALEIDDEAFTLLFTIYRTLRKEWLTEFYESGANINTAVPPYLTDAGAIVSPKRLETFFQLVGSHEQKFYVKKNDSNDVLTDRSFASKREADRLRFRKIIAGEQNAADRNLNNRSETYSNATDSNELDVYSRPLPEGFQVVLSNSASPLLQIENKDISLDSEVERTDIVSQMRNVLKVSLAGKADDDDVDFHVDDEDLKGRYYSDKFGFSPFDAEQHIALRAAYIKGLLWNLHYYYQGVASWQWFYPYHYGPMISDLVNLEDIIEEITFDTEIGQPLKPFEQLMACLPPSKAYLLPEPYRPLLTDPTSPIADFYPSSITIDMNGKRLPWEAVVLIPFIDTNRLLEAMKTVDETQLSPGDQHRNRVEAAIVFSWKPEKSDAELDLGNTSTSARKDECKVDVVPFEESDLHCAPLYSSSKFSSKLLPGVVSPLPGFPTLRDGSLKSVDVGKIYINVHGDKSKFKTLYLSLFDSMLEVLPLETIAKLIGTIVYINYPHFIEAYVTSVSDSEFVIRGSEAPRRLTFEEAKERIADSDSFYSSYLRGNGLSGSGGLKLMGISDSKRESDIRLTVKAFSGFQKLENGVVVKKFSDREIQVPLFVTNWIPHKLDPRLSGVPLLLEKNPYKAGLIENLNQEVKKFKPRVPSRQKKGRQFHSLAFKSLTFGTNSIETGAIFRKSEVVFKAGPLAPRDSVCKSSFASSNFVGITFAANTFGPLHKNMAPSQRTIAQLGSLQRAAINQAKCQTSFENKRAFRYVKSINSTSNLIAIGVLSVFAFFSGVNSEQFRTSLSYSGASRRVYFNIAGGAQEPGRGVQYDVSSSEASYFGPEFSHGTTTISFVFKDGIITAVDSRASLDHFVGSKTTQKVLPVNSHIIGTMAGGAADCSHWIRKLRSEANLYELTEGRRMSVERASRLLSNWLYEYRQRGLSVGTMLMGFNDDAPNKPILYYVDSAGARIKGDIFAVGSGSNFALGILDTADMDLSDMNESEAISIGIRAIRHATFRDASSGGFINAYLITNNGWRLVFSEDIDRKCELADSL